MRSERKWPFAERFWSAVVNETLRSRVRALRRTVFCRSLGLKESASALHQNTAPRRHVYWNPRVPTWLTSLLLHRPGFVALAPESLLMGCQIGLDPVAFAKVTRDPWYGSTPMLKSPHVELLESAMNADRALTDAEIMSSNYWSFAQVNVKISGEFFGMRSEQELLQVVRNFLDWVLGDTARVTILGGSGVEDAILVARVPSSSLFQIVDGHHRVAAAITHGQTLIRVRRTWLSTGVPLHEE